VDQIGKILVQALKIGLVLAMIEDAEAKGLFKTNIV
jgi:hypothetical protein